MQGTSANVVTEATCVSKVPPDAETSAIKNQSGFPPGASLKASSSCKKFLVFCFFRNASQRPLVLKKNLPAVTSQRAEIPQKKITTRMFLTINPNQSSLVHCFCGLEAPLVMSQGALTPQTPTRLLFPPFFLNPKRQSGL